MTSPYALSTEIINGIAVITIDLPGEPVNKFNRAVKDEFVALFDRLERDLNVRAAVLISGKKDSFIAGADIEEFLELKTAAEAERLSHEGQLLLDSIHEQRTPLVVAIHGACMGGALELSL
ncbi:MAG: enoyl-CoA hydratase-related protein, partial [Gemmatimonas sp.]